VPCCPGGGDADGDVGQVLAFADLVGDVGLDPVDDGSTRSSRRGRLRTPRRYHLVDDRCDRGGEVGLEVEDGRVELHQQHRGRVAGQPQSASVIFHSLVGERGDVRGRDGLLDGVVDLSRGGQ
jgi:hypothetical protein